MWDFSAFAVPILADTSSKLDVYTSVV